MVLAATKVLSSTIQSSNVNFISPDPSLTTKYDYQQVTILKDYKYKTARRA
jgi:hypothetical protein